MENQNNNNLSELDQLKAQYETLKQQFDQQEIVNDRLMKSSIKHSADFYGRYRRRQFILYPLFAIIGLLYIIFLLQGNNLSLSLFWLTFCSVCFAMELWMTQKLKSKEVENNDLLTLSHQARNFKKLFSLFTALNYSTGIILAFGVVLASLGREINLPNIGTVVLLLVGLLVFFVLLGLYEIRYKTRACNEIIQQIEAAEPTTDKKTSLDRTQKWFRIAMIVVFIGLDIWACLLVSKYIKTPPIYSHSGYKLEYERGAGNLTTEGTLEVRPMDADTVAISSELLGGKPIVQHVEVTVPSMKSDTDLVQINVTLTPEASLLWYQFTTKAKGHHAALYLDGVQIQDWQIKCGISNGSFFIMKERSSMKELDAFCEQLIRQ
jgi:hypothetical protein